MASPELEPPKTQSGNFMASYPTLALEWDPSNSISPYEVSAGSSKRVAWRCHKGHTWVAAVKKRTSGHGCPVCSGKKIVAGVNDLASLNPELAREWHPDRNDRSPADVGRSGRYRAWWVCRLGHEWQAPVNRRASGTGCPVCSGRSVIKGENDLASLRPDLAREWSESNARTPESVTENSSLQVEWTCRAGHRWTAPVARRASGAGCPYCSGHKVLKGFNDIASQFPELATEWAGDNARSPQSVSHGSQYVAHWECANGHTWRASVASRTAGRGCPSCSGRRLIPGQNDLATRAPHLALEWDASNEVGPDALHAKSGRVVVWRCAQGHRWSASLLTRSKGHGCPFCSNQAVQPGENDLATTHPELAAEWHPQRNSRTAAEFTAGSGFRAVWYCSQAHEWEATIATRLRGSGCPECADSGFSQTEPSIVYLMEHQSGLALKVGIANVGTNRLAQLERDGWMQLDLYPVAEGWMARFVEGRVLRELRGARNLKPAFGPEDLKYAGWTETFSSRHVSVSDIQALIAGAFDEISDS